MQRPNVQVGTVETHSPCLSESVDEVGLQSFAFCGRRLFL